MDAKDLSGEKPSQDPLVKAVKKAYRSSRQFELDQLLEAESRWKRKATIAHNKLTEVRAKINELAQTMVDEIIKGKPE